MALIFLFASGQSRRRLARDVISHFFDTHVSFVHDVTDLAEMRGLTTVFTDFTKIYCFDFCFKYIPSIDNNNKIKKI